MMVPILIAAFLWRSPGVTPPMLDWPAPTRSFPQASLLDTLARRLRPFDAVIKHGHLLASQHPRTPQADSAFSNVFDAYVQLAETLTAILGGDSTGAALEADQSAWAAVDSLLHRHGFVLNATEGNAFVDQDMAYLLAQFGTVVTPAMRQYLVIRRREMETRFSEDAALMLPWDSVGNRVAQWDAFLQQFPSFTWHEASIEWRDLYLATYLTGMDNTPTISDSGTLNADVASSYHRFLLRHLRTASATVIRDYAFLFAHGAAPADTAIKRFLREHRLRGMMGVEPPTN